MSVAPAGVALTGNTPGPESKYRLAPNRNNQWPSRLQILTELHAWRGDPPVLPDVPVTVISGSLADGMPRRVRDAATAAGRYRAARSRQGRHVVAARSGHYIPATEPDLIAAEIRRLVLPPVG